MMEFVGKDKNVHDTAKWVQYFENSKQNLFSQAVNYQLIISKVVEYTPKGGKILETGCGSGLSSILLSDMGFHVTALDIDTNVVQYVKNKAAKYNIDIDVVKGSMLDLPYKTEDFDTVFHQGVLEHFTDDQIITALKQQKNVSKKIVFEVPNSRYGHKPYGDERLLKNSYWKELIHQSGLKIVEMYGKNHSQAYRFLKYLLPHGMYLRFPIFSIVFGRSIVFVLE